MGRVKIEIKVQCEYEVMFCDRELTPGAERVALRGERGLEAGDELVLRGQAGVRFRVGGFYFSDPPDGTQHCMLVLVAGDQELREGMILVLVEEPEQTYA